jgi:hypothetical protein
MAEKRYVTYRLEEFEGSCVFLYPADWKARAVAENGRREVFITGPRNRAGTYSTSLAVAVTPSVASSAAEAAAELLARYRAAFNSQGTGPSATTVAGLPAVEVEMVYAMPLPPNSIRPQWTEIRQCTVFFKRGEHLYELHYAAPAGDYLTWLPAFHALVQSFAFETETVRPALRRPAAIPAFQQVREDAPEYEAGGSQPDEQPEQRGG